VMGVNTLRASRGQYCVVMMIAVGWMAVVYGYVMCWSCDSRPSACFWLPAAVSMGLVD
jgi:hypothetical protein